MAEEIEVKFLNIDKEALERKLKEVGAKKVADYSYRRRVFDYPDGRLDRDYSWLRLRDEGNQVTLSFKKRLRADNGDPTAQDIGMEEVEVKVSDFDTTALLLHKLGFVDKHYVENKRTRWLRDEVEFDIDTYPRLEPYLEIEAPSWQKIDEAIVLLGLNPADKKIFSTNQVYALVGINVDDYVKLTFDELVKK